MMSGGILLGVGESSWIARCVESSLLCFCVFVGRRCRVVIYVGRGWRGAMSPYSFEVFLIFHYFLEDPKFSFFFKILSF